jgi:predicted dehydrogenase
VFGKDLLIDPANRDVKDVKHEIVAAAASNSTERARAYLDEIKAPATAAAYGSYKELVNDENVDIIYVATPHSHHFQNAMLCLTAGKHVLLEKAFTVNAAQSKILIELARKKGLFLMEAVWTRFTPLSVEVRKLVADGKIGKVHRVLADWSFNFDLEKTHGTKN